MPAVGVAVAVRRRARRGCRGAGGGTTRCSRRVTTARARGQRGCLPARTMHLWRGSAVGGWLCSHHEAYGRSGGGGGWRQQPLSSVSVRLPSSPVRGAPRPAAPGTPSPPPLSPPVPAFPHTLASRAHSTRVGRARTVGGRPRASAARGPRHGARPSRPLGRAPPPAAAASAPADSPPPGDGGGTVVVEGQVVGGPPGSGAPAARELASTAAAAVAAAATAAAETAVVATAAILLL